MIKNFGFSTLAEAIFGVKTFLSNPILNALTASRVPYIDSNKQIAVSSVTPTELGYLSGVTSAIQAQINAKEATIRILPETGPWGVNDGIAYYVAPPSLNGLNLTSVWMAVDTVSSSGLPTLQINNSRTGDMLSTRLTIDATEYSSDMALTPAVIDTTKDDILTGDRLRFDIDVAGTGTLGATIYMKFSA